VCGGGGGIYRWMWMKFDFFGFFGVQTIKNG
jgi:hypothetical protein